MHDKVIYVIIIVDLPWLTFIFFGSIEIRALMNNDSSRPWNIEHVATSIAMKRMPHYKSLLSSVYIISSSRIPVGIILKLSIQRSEENDRQKIRFRRNFFLSASSIKC